MTVTDFEHLGAVTVRPRTLRDGMITIPSIQDAELGDNMAPSEQTRYNALLIAIARAAIVEPTDFVDNLLESTDIKDFGFLGAFAKEYTEWVDGRLDEAREKKSGKEKLVAGNESAS